MTRYEEIVLRRILELCVEMRDAINANDVHQYDGDIRAMRNTRDELLDLLVEFSRPVMEDASDA